MQSSKRRWFSNELGSARLEYVSDLLLCTTELVSLKVIIRHEVAHTHTRFTSLFPGLPG